MIDLYNSCKNNLKNQNGAVMMFVLLAFVVLMILIGSMSMLFSSNLKQAVYQQTHMEAYYIAQAGIEIAMASLLQEDVGGIPWKDELTTVGETISEEADLDNGTATITITTLPVNAANHIEIEVNSIGEVADGGSTYELTMIFDAQNPEIQRWE